ncbi:GtrA family protein [Paenibacillus sp. S02]|uniref:GtrA family protein n=1 Tax=Paenibacillus sp. S02 TaxID=2823904 RepID=UPI001C64FD1D|nr:GtrA family protein [Paenibacillus sp. S02]QYK69594.1 GtrA-like protein [Paenibacillus sp. S02]
MRAESALHILWTRLTNKEFLKFLISGGLNTLATYAIYLALIGFVDYKISYSISYVCGIVLSFLLNALFVFKQKVSLMSFIKYPIVYIVQYLISLLMLFTLVRIFHIPEIIVPLIVTIVTIPITFVLSRLIIRAN